MRPAILGAISGGGSAALDTDVQSWLTRVASASGTVSAGTQTAVNTFVLACKAASIWTLFRRLNLCVGDFNASFVPLVNTSGGTTDTNINLVSGDYSESLGWQTDGSTKCINTGYTPSEATGGLSVYLRTTQTSNTTARVPIGSRNAGSTQIYRIGGNLSDLGATSGGVISIWGENILTPGDCPQTTGGLTATLWHGVRTASNAARLFKAGVSVGTSTASKTPSTPAAALYVLAQNAAGTAASFLESGSRLAGYGCDIGMNQTQAADYYTAMQAFQTAMGRQV